jgi:hypothetical protein
MTYTFRGRNPDGTWHETTGLTAEQAAKLASGQAIAYTPTDERILVSQDGAITFRESAVPPSAAH